MIAGNTFTATLQTQFPKGVLIDADVLPSVDVYRNGIQTTLDVSISRLSLGIYKYSFFVPDHWIVGDTVDLHFYTVIDSITVRVIKQISVNDIKEQTNFNYTETAIVGSARNTSRTIRGRIG